MAVCFLFVNFVVGNGRLQIRIPVDEPFASIDQTVLEHLEECLTHCLGTNIVQRETDASPVTTGSDALELAEDSLFVSVLPLPDSLNERIATDVIASQAFFFLHPLFDHGLRRNTGMICSGHPESFVALHAAPASQQILQRPVQGVPHMERAGHVWQRDHDHMRRLRWIGICVETAL